ncbi:hypothetical protein, partial [Pseudomonas syringae group genomosp. 7]|uniref:hypothetical protein n=1 Tax=Pseudomonas syringae group genomosp. 7 TaxID=251699 RepID=UPI00376FFE09
MWVFLWFWWGGWWGCVVCVVLGWWGGVVLGVVVGVVVGLGLVVVGGWGGGWVGVGGLWVERGMVFDLGIWVVVVFGEFWAVGVGFAGVAAIIRGNRSELRKLHGMLSDSR